MKKLVMTVAVLAALSVQPLFAVQIKWLLVVIPTASAPTSDYVSKFYDSEAALDADAQKLAETQYRNLAATFQKIDVDLDKKKEQFEFKLQKIAK